MGDSISMLTSVDSALDETLNWGPLALLLRRQYEFPFGINTVQFSFFFHFHETKRLADFSLNVYNFYQSSFIPIFQQKLNIQISENIKR